ncbi:hypothetical protein HZS_1519 [Henneguya salminicola]|nr:hypothetical protein HZS_1519 [Henneguya salminicola]
MSEQIENLEMILSDKRKKTSCSSSHLYRIGRENIQNNYIFWRCLLKICRNTMRTSRDGNLILNNTNIHNHAPNPYDLSKRRIISDVHIRERTTTEHPRRLLADYLNRSIPSVSPLIPSYNSLQRNVQII